MSEISEERIAPENTQLLYLEGGRVHSGKLLACGKSKVRVLGKDGQVRRLDRRKWLAKLPEGDAEGVIAQAEGASNDVDMAQVWKQAAGECLGLEDLSARAMPNAQSTVAQIALQIAHSRQGGYFYVQGHETWQPVGEEQYQAVCKSKAKDRKNEERTRNWASSLADGERPVDLVEYLKSILEDGEDTDDLRHQFLLRHCRKHKTNMDALLLDWNIVRDHERLHLRQFKDNGSVDLAGKDIDGLATRVAGLPKLGDDAIAIDSHDTMEVDDAIELQDETEGEAVILIHIAAPALGMPNAAREQAIANCATTYLPGDRQLMLPREVVTSYSLEQGVTKPCVSLRLRVALKNHEIVDHEFVLGKVALASQVPVERCTGSFASCPGIDPRAASMLEKLDGVSEKLQVGRQGKGRGAHVNHAGHLVKLIKGTPEILSREDFAMADRMVARLMVIYNKFACAYLSKVGFCYLQRQDGRVNVSPKGIKNSSGVNGMAYGWFTSPLRRLADLINQETLLAALEGKDAPHSKDELLGMGEDFNKRYVAIQNIQKKMETYWSLCWLESNGRLGREETGHTTRDSTRVRLDAAPVRVHVTAHEMGANKPVKVRLDTIDKMRLVVRGSIT